MQTTYVKYTKKSQSRIEIFELENTTTFNQTLKHFELLLDGWTPDESLSLTTDLKTYPAIVPQYSK